MGSEMTGIREKHDIRHVPLLLWKRFPKKIHQNKYMQEPSNYLQNDTARPVLLFDGACALCNRSVLFVLRKEKKPVLQFASLQGETAKIVLAQTLTGAGLPKSLVLIEQGQILTESAAVMGVCKYLGGVWPLLRVGMLVPAFLRNALYRFIAARRYRWFGKTEFCLFMPEKYRDRFLP